MNQLTPDEKAAEGLLEDNTRLRKLVADAEERGCKCGPAAELSGCPWCNSTQRFDDETLNPVFEHEDGCPAFSAKGVVR